MTAAQDQTPAGQAALVELYRSSLALRGEVARTIAEPAAIDEEIHLPCEALVAAEDHLVQ